MNLQHHAKAVRANRIEIIPQPLANQSPGKLNANHSLAQTQYLRFVAHHRLLDREAVVRGDGLHIRDFVGGNYDT